MDGNFDHPYAWNNFTRGITPGSKRIMEDKLMDQWTNAFAKDFYRQLKADQKEKLQ